MKRIFIGTLLLASIVIFNAQTQIIGQRFIFSLPQNVTNQQLQQWLAQTKPAGVMLLASHFRNRNQTKELISFLQQEAAKLGLPKLLITVDWEGGIVSRPNEMGGFFSVPSPWSLAQAGPEACFLAGSLIGSQCRSVGVNMDFAPLADIFKNHILATRCFSCDPETIAACCIAFSQGLLIHGVLPVVKHFPGLGLGKGDTHLVSVGIKVSDGELEKSTAPFKASLRAGVPCIMITHAQFDQFGDMSTTLSPAVVNYLKACNDKTLLITDDFAMKAVQNCRTVDEAVMLAWDAGFHLIIFSGKPEEQIELVRTLEQKYQSASTQQQTAFDQACAFIEQFKHAFIMQQPTAQPIADEAEVSAQLACRCIIPSSRKAVPWLSGKDLVLISIDLPKIRPAEFWFINENQSYLAQLLRKVGSSVDELILNPLQQDGSTWQLQKILDELDDQTTIILQTFFYADGPWNVCQQEWLELLKPYQDKLIVISLGHPCEQSALPDAYTLNLGSFNRPLLDRAAQMLGKKNA